MTSPAAPTLKDYALVEQIGQGAFGAIYRARQRLVGREVAIKIILPQYANQPDFIRRFEAEAQLVARLEHLHIVPLYDYWRDPSGACLVMRLMRGGSLEGALKRGPLPCVEAARVLDQIGSALAAAHRQGVIHRDLKPANILLDEEGNAYLSDFGIAKAVGAEAQTMATGGILGTPAYMSPEQVQGGPITPQTDIYSLGVMLYEMLTGKHPFSGSSIGDLIVKHLTAPLPPVGDVLPDLPAALDEVIRRATAKDPAARYPDAQALSAAVRRILSGETAPALAATGLTVATNPYKGLRAFQEADADDFFGREALTRRLLARLGEQGEACRFLAVVGPSGSGKSSVVRAGLLPSLRHGALPGSENWFFVDMLPGVHPLDELEIGLTRVSVNPGLNLGEQLRRDARGLLRAARMALPSDQDELLLVVDQFEEVFTLARDRQEARHVLGLLYTAATDPGSRVRVVIALRADFYDRPLMVPDFSTLLQRRTEVVVPLTAEELERAIRGPAERVGLALEAGLDARIVADVVEQPGALPLLQYALTELFERRAGRLLTSAAYESIGGVLGALGRRAGEVYAGLDPVAQSMARQLFLRLVTLGEGTEDTRRRVLRAELEALGGQPAALVDQVLTGFGGARLLSFDRDALTRGATVEIAHEALLREWRRLHEWLDESRGEVRLQRALAHATAEWHAAGRDASFLLGGSRLQQFEDWAASATVALTDEERAYLEASIAARQAQEAEEEARRQRELTAAQQLAEAERRRAAAQAQSARRLRWGALGLAGLALVATVLAFVAFQARSTAQQERDNAQRAAAVNHSLVLAADAQKAFNIGDTDLALALAFEAVRLDAPPTEAVRTLLGVVLGPGTRAVFKGHTSAVRAVAFSPDGRYAASGSCAQPDAAARCSGGELIVWDLGAHAELYRFRIHAGWINAVAFSADGKYVLSGSGDGTLALSAVDTGQVLRRFEGHSAGVNTLALSHDGSTALSGSDDASLILWNVETGALMRRFTGHKSSVTSVAFSPECPGPPAQCLQTALSGSADKNLMLWDVATGAVVRTITGHTDRVTGVAYLPDGQRVLSISGDLSMRQWDLKTGAEVLSQRFGTAPQCLVLSSDGRTAVKQYETLVQLWDVEEWHLTQTLLGHSETVRALAVSPDRRYALSGADDKTLRLWNVKGQDEVGRLRSPGEFTVAVAASPDGRHLLSGGRRGGALWDVEQGALLRRFPTDYQVSPGAVAFSPDGHYAVLGTTGRLAGKPDKTELKLWDVATGQIVRSFVGHKIPVRSLAFGPHGRVVLSGSQGKGVTGELILWDVGTGQEIRRFDTRKDITGIAFSADGRRALTGSVNGFSLSLWDVETGKEIRHFGGHTAPVFAVAFGPGDRTVLSASGDTSVVQWNADTGAVVRRFTSHRGPVWALDVSADKRYVLSGASDGAVIEWDLTTGEEVKRLMGHTAWVPSVAFGRDGRSAFSISTDGTIIKWRIAGWSVEELAAWVRGNRYLRDLTCKERAQYRVEPLCGAQ